MIYVSVWCHLWSCHLFRWFQLFCYKLCIFLQKSAFFVDFFQERRKSTKMPTTWQSQCGMRFLQTRSTQWSTALTFEKKNNARWTFLHAVGHLYEIQAKHHVHRQTTSKYGILGSRSAFETAANRVTWNLRRNYVMLFYSFSWGSRSPSIDAFQLIPKK